MVILFLIYDSMIHICIHILLCMAALSFVKQHYVLCDGIISDEAALCLFVQWHLVLHGGILLCIMAFLFCKAVFLFVQQPLFCMAMLYFTMTLCAAFCVVWLPFILCHSTSFCCSNISKMKWHFVL